MKIEPLVRTITLTGARADSPIVGDDRRVELSFSSEAPVERWFGSEILDHSPGNARMDRLNEGAPVLFNHGLGDLRGVVESARIGDDRRGYAVLRFATNEAGEEALQLVNDRILRNVSFLYRIHEWEQTSKEAAADILRVVDWEPLEVSFVTVPADQSVGVGRMDARDFPLDAREVKVRTIQRSPLPPENRVMPDPVVDPNAAPAPGPTPAGAPDPGAAAAATRIAASSGPAPEDIRKADEERTRSIYGLAEANGIAADQARGWVERGTSWNQITDDILAIQKQRGANRPESISALDLTAGETQQYNLPRAILAARDGQWDKAGFELSCHEEIAKRTNKIPGAGAFFVPLEVQRRPRPVDAARLAQQMGIGRRDLNAAVGAEGGFTVATSVMGFDELLRNMSFALRLGAQRLTGLRDNITIPRQSAAATAEWLTSETDTATESQQTFTQLSLSPKTVSAYTELSRQLLLQSSLDVEGLVNQDLAAVAALALDVAVLTGTGATGQPLGLDNVAGVGAVSGTTLAFAGVLECQTDVASANVIPVSGGYVTTPAVAAMLMQRVKFTSTATPLWEGNVWGGSMVGMQAASTNQVAAATMYFGDWAKAVIAEWGVLEVETNPFANFPAGIIGVRVMYSVDVGIRYPGAFTIVTSIT